MIFSLQRNTMCTDNLKVLVLKFLGMKDVVFFEPKSWWKGDIYWLLKSSCFEFFGDGKYGLFWVKKLIETMTFTDYWKVLVLNFSVVGNTVFFGVKKLMERWYLLITERFLFWTFWWWEIRSFFSQKVGGKMIFTWSSWAFYDIPKLGKYGSLCSVKQKWNMHKVLKNKIIFKIIVTLLLQEVKMNVKSTYVKLTMLKVCQPGQAKKKPIEQILARMIDFVIVPASLFDDNGFFASFSSSW